MARGKLDIETYNRKRDFTKTKEPKGRRLKGKGDSFVVQKHDASRLHWDFRLELDGVLKSWAVPKGPSLDPDDKRLAVRTEDHPLDYGEFEGIIPKGEYGGGTVMLWDKGRWQPEPGKDPRKTIEEGHLHFTLDGERMKGEWVMFRLKARPGERQEPWMLKKVDDRFAKPERGRGAGRAMCNQRHHRPQHGRNRRRRRRVAFDRQGREERQGEAPGWGRTAEVSSRRNWRRWSMRCRAATTGCTNINMTVTGCCLPPRMARPPPGRETATIGATGSGRSSVPALEASGGLPDRRRGRRARQ